MIPVEAGWWPQIGADSYRKYRRCGMFANVINSNGFACYAKIEPCAAAGKIKRTMRGPMDFFPLMVWRLSG